MLHIHWKGNFCTTYSHFLKAISCHMFLFWEAFSCHIQHICTFAKHLATYSTYVRFIWKVFASCYLFYIHMYMVNNIFTPSRYKEIIMVQPKPSAGLKGKPHQHALIFMPSCIQKSKAWVPRPKSFFGIYPSPRKLSTPPKMEIIHAQTQSISNIRKLMRKRHWGISLSTWWAHFWVRITRGWGQCGFPHHFKTQPRPKVIPYNPPIQWIKAQICPKLSHEISQIMYNLEHKKASTES